MKLRSILVLALALACAPAMAQVNPGTSPLTVPKGGTGGATASAARTSLGLAIGTNVEAWDADLDCLAANSTAGQLTYTGAGTCAARTLTAPVAGFTITNPAGTAGNPTFVLANDLAAVEGLSGTGIARRTGTDAWSVGTIVSIAEGGTGQATQQAALNAIAPTPTRAGDIIYWNGSNWVALAGNNSGTLTLQENASGVPVWASVAGTGTVTSAVIAAGAGISVTGTCTITTSGTCTVNSLSHVLLNTLTASASATLSDTTSLTSTYSVYEIVFQNIIPATASTTCQIQSHSGGAFQTSSYVSSQLNANGTGTGLGVVTGSVPCNVGTSISNVGPGISGSIRVTAPSGTAVPKLWQGMFAHQGATAILWTVQAGGYWASNAAVDGFQVCFSSSVPTCNVNITSGVIKIYGIQ
jgi:hypothetical protein